MTLDFVPNRTSSPHSHNISIVAIVLCTRRNFLEVRNSYALVNCQLSHDSRTRHSDIVMFQASATGGLGSVKAEVMADTAVALASANVQVVSRKVIGRLDSVRWCLDWSLS